MTKSKSERRSLLPHAYKSPTRDDQISKKTPYSFRSKVASYFSRDDPPQSKFLSYFSRSDPPQSHPEQYFSPERLSRAGSRVTLPEAQRRLSQNSMQGAESDNEVNSPTTPYSPASFTSGLLSSRRYKQLESYDFSHPEWVNLDLFQSHSSLAQQDLYKFPGEHDKSHAFFSLLWRMSETPVLLILIGCLAASIGWLITTSITCLIALREAIMLTSDSSFLSPLVYGSVCFSFAMSSALITHFFCPIAAGGGVPEMKSVLSGSINSALLSPLLIAVKLSGLVLASAAGLSVGKEGPLIHLCCAISELLMSLPIFRYIRVNAPKRVEILTCACAAGVAASFGSAFGATLFSVEITSTCYVVSGLARAFITAIVVAVLYWYWGVNMITGLYEGPDETVLPFNTVDLLLWCFLGVLCGLLGWLFVWLVSSVSKWRNNIARPSLGAKTQRQRKLMICAFFTLLVIPLSYWELKYFERWSTTSEHSLVDHLFTPRNLGLSWDLAIYVLFKATAIIFSVTQPLPVGLFAPVFILGASFGRLFGEAVTYIETTHGTFGGSFEPWEFSVIGAAACSGSITRAVSTAVIVFEMTGKNSLRLPLGLAVLIAHTIASRFTRGIYESLVDTNSAPYLPKLPRKAYLVEVQNIMVPASNLPYLALSTTYSAAARLLSQHPASLCQTIPVVQTTQDMLLVGAVLRKDLAMAVHDYEERVTAAEMEASPEDTLKLIEAVKKYERKAAGLSPTTHSRHPSVSYQFKKQDSLANGHSKRRSVSDSLIRDTSINKKVSLDGSLLGGAHLRFVVVKGGNKVAPVVDTKGTHYCTQHMLRLSSIDTIPIIMDPSPLQVAQTTELRKLDYMFRMLKLDIAFVCRAGRLVGWVTRGTIRRFVGQREPKPMDECISLCNSFSKPKTALSEGQAKKRPDKYDSFREIGTVSSLRAAGTDNMFHPI